MLLLYDKLFELKACVLKGLHHIKRHRNHMPLLPCVTHQDRAELVLFQNSVAFRRDWLHLLNKILNLTVRQILRDVLTVFYYISVRRMSADKVNALVRDKVEVPRVAFVNRKQINCIKYLTII